MLDDDVLLIHKILSGDDTAFSTLVQRYQKGVHAFAWRKIGDFHHAEEITQDTFIQVYKNLSTLKNPNHFAGWLYVIANRLCIKWQEKRRTTIQSLEGTSIFKINTSSYNRYISEQREAESTEKRLEIVNNLLKKLPESERTVITLYYLGEMTAKEIGKFLGVSINTIKSRLRRARQRLKEEEAMIQENLSSIQFPTQMTENIMNAISQLKPNTPSGSKPLIPLGISAASAIIVLLMIGIGGQYLFQFQQPYSLEATSEATIELVDTQIVLASPADTAERNQIGLSETTNNSNGEGQKPDTTLFNAAHADDIDISKPSREWVPTKGPEGGPVDSVFTSTRGDVYAGTLNGLYKLTNDGQAWKLVHTIKDAPYATQYTGSTWWLMAERQDTVYLVTSTEILASTDRGETWSHFCECIKGKLVDVALTDGIQGAQSDMTIYLAYTNGVFRSDNDGKSWTPLPDGITDRKIHAITAIGNTVFVGTDKGLFRLKSDTWEQVQVDGKVENVRALASAGDRLYVDVGKKAQNPILSQFLSMMTTRKPPKTLFRSTDMGDSWESIDPEKRHLKMSGKTTIGFSSGKTSTESTNTVKIVAHQDNLLIIERDNNYYSKDAGDNWKMMPTWLLDNNSLPEIAILNENTFYSNGDEGVYRTTDAGKGWTQLSTGLANTFVMNLVVVNDALYANIGRGLVVSYDGGESWATVRGETQNIHSMLKANGVLYIKSSDKLMPELSHLPAKNQWVSSIPGMPNIEVPDFNKLMEEKIGQAFLATLQEEAEKDIEEGKKIDPEQFDTEKFNESYSQIVDANLNQSFLFSFGNFAVSGATYYMESNQKLFRWKPGAAEWHNTGLIDDSEYGEFDSLDSIGFKIAVSGDTVYVGKREGHLMLSSDEGDMWQDVTDNLPFVVEQFHDITFAGQNVYVATDKGVVWSNNGLKWHTLTGPEGKPLFMRRLVVDDTTVYGESNHTIYQLSRNTGNWQQVTPKIPHFVICFDVDGDTVYVGTAGRGVLRFSL